MRMQPPDGPIDAPAPLRNRRIPVVIALAVIVLIVAAVAIWSRGGF
jgi:hypothetical protein